MYMSHTAYLGTPIHMYNRNVGGASGQGPPRLIMVIRGQLRLRLQSLVGSKPPTVMVTLNDPSATASLATSQGCEEGECSCGWTPDYECRLSPEDVEYSDRVLGESPWARNTALHSLHHWLALRPHLHPDPRPSNLLRFLRCTKFNLDKAESKLTKYYELRGAIPEWFQECDPRAPHLQQLLRLGVFLPLLDRDSQGRLVVIIRVAVHDPKHHNQNDVFKVGTMVLDWVLERAEDTSVHGVAAVFDLRGIAFKHAKALSVSMIRKAVHTWQEYPVRVRSLDFVFSPPYVNVVLNVFKTYMSAKLRSRVHVHGWDLASLHACVEPAVLPAEYGGQAPPINSLIGYWRDTITADYQWFIQQEQFRARPPP